MILVWIPGQVVNGDTSYPHLIDSLHSAGFYSLKDIGSSTVSHLMEQGWISAEVLGFAGDQEINAWNGYLSILK